jgi:hypothetical protein
MDIAQAKTFLRGMMQDQFKDKTFRDYINFELAGDFAVEIATVVQRLQRVEKAAKAIADNAEECEWEDAAGFAASLDYLSELNDALDEGPRCPECECEVDKPGKCLPCSVGGA